MDPSSMTFPHLSKGQKAMAAAIARDCLKNKRVWGVRSRRKLSTKSEPSEVFTRLE
jgi:hypothetical protein